MNKPFAEISIGTKFKFNGVEYTKIEDVRVSCCRVINSRKNDDGSNHYINPTTEVEVLNA